ncbi:MAG: YggS family pyridoxal phosphate-dependent enzyme [Nitrospinota bacterium]|nr:YggS family pyridoxal phosphate-dependent enzyme [Nitrospinota bacterium]
MPVIADNIRKILERIEQAAAKSGRDPKAVELVAVTKTVGADQALEAVLAGMVSLGESRVQEARDKYSVIGPRARWHLIGPLQTNKAKYCPGLFHLIHSVDRMELFRELARQAARKGSVVHCLLQVNLSGEKQKSGCRAEDAERIVKEAALLEGVRIQGLMTVPPYSDDPEESRPYFRELCQLAGRLDALGVENVTMDRISAGMTNDFEVAVEEGATIVRVGSAIFGERL